MIKPRLKPLLLILKKSYEKKKEQIIQNSNSKRKKKTKFANTHEFDVNNSENFPVKSLFQIRSMEMSGTCTACREKVNLDYSAEVLKEHRIGAGVGSRAAFGDCGQHLGSCTTHDLTLILLFSPDLGTTPSVKGEDDDDDDDDKRTGEVSWDESSGLGSPF